VGGLSDLSRVLQSEDERALLAIASKCCIEANRFDWYDSKFLRRFEAAKQFLRLIGSKRLDEFVAGFDVLRTKSDFELQFVDAVFDNETFDLVLETVHALPYVVLEHYESESFGRSLLRHHPFFTTLQVSLSPRVSELVGEEVSPAYNFLSLYRGLGRCDPHLDQPLSKWTLDICIEQSVEWPIYISQVVDWPAEAPPVAPTIEGLRADSSLRCKPVTLAPNRGVLFSGSSQWHFREPIAGRGSDFCHLLFLHYLPTGAEALANPRAWAEYFDMPELDILAAADDLVIRKVERAGPV
jgi:hypothetical protein